MFPFVVGKRKVYNVRFSMLFWKCGKVQIFGNDINKRKLHLWRNYEQIYLRDWLLLFRPDSFVFPFAVQKYKT